MSVLSCQNVSVSFAQREIIRCAAFDVASGDKIGLIGANGSGKTTLFKVITGALEPSEGRIVKANHIKIGCVEQHACEGSTLTVYEELLTVFRFFQDMERELEELHNKIDATGGTYEYIEKQTALSEKYQNSGGLTYKALAHSCLKGLGFSEAQELLPVSALSGGQRTKLSLGKLLLSEPDIMLLDEPTNHLDIQSVEWLEDFISKFKGSAIIISHDRYFLDKTTSRTIEIYGKRLICSKGSYTQHMRNKEQRLESEHREYEKAALEIKRLQKMIEQQKQFNQERNYITIASKEKQIERIREQMPQLPEKEKSVKLKFQSGIRSGDEVLIAEQLKKEYDGKLLFEGVDLKIFRGERVFLLGPNGCGKTTLLAQLIGKVDKDSGFSRFGHNVTVGYYEQSLASFSTEKTLLNEMYDRFPTFGISALRGYLGAFNFKNDDIDKKMSELSGGERARVALLSLILKKPNFLILDEPTNHLDFASREVLEDALAEFDGTLLSVSHDRYFVNRLATKILSFEGTSVREYDGNYDDYINRLSAMPAEKAQPNKKSNNDYKIRREQERDERKRKSRMQKLEDIIAAAEGERDALNERLSAPETAADYELIIELGAEISRLTADIEAAESEWLELSEKTPQ